MTACSSTSHPSNSCRWMGRSCSGCPTRSCCLWAWRGLDTRSWSWRPWICSALWSVRNQKIPKCSCLEMFLYYITVDFSVRCHHSWVSMLNIPVSSPLRYVFSSVELQFLFNQTISNDADEKLPKLLSVWDSAEMVSGPHKHLPCVTNHELTELAVSKEKISIWASQFELPSIFGHLSCFSGLSWESTPGETQDWKCLGKSGESRKEGGLGNLCLDSLADAFKFSSRAEDDPFLSITNGSALNLV